MAKASEADQEDLERVADILAENLERLMSEGIEEPLVINSS
jgi:hypothetical protein